MYRSHNCGELRIKHVGQEVKLSGWIHKIRDKGSLIWIDLRDRYGITQIIVDTNESSKNLFEQVKKVGREYVISVKGMVKERESKNPNIGTGDIEITLQEIEILNKSKVPPFTLDENTDGGDELRMKYRYLDIRRDSIKNNLIFRNSVTLEIRKYLNELGFIDVETPYLIKSTPEGARDFVVPSRINKGEFYALPQSPQTFKQLLMVGGIDKYCQVVKCFRDEDLRSDRQPEFTQIDCEMSFVNQDDVLLVFENLIKNIFKKCISVELDNFPKIPYWEAIENYGSDKPDTRFDMKIFDCTKSSKGKGFKILDDSEYVCGITVNSAEPLSRKQIDQYTDWVKQPQIGAKGLIWIKHNNDGSFKSSIDKFYNHDDLLKIVGNFSEDSTTFLISGNKMKSLTQLGQLRLKIADDLKLIDPKKFCPLWVNDFPLFDWDEDDKKYHSIHHPFTSPKDKNMNEIKEASNVVADAYDLVINGNEIGGGSIRIHNRDLQNQIFSILGFSEKEAKEQFGFLMNAFEYGAPPHGGIALGLDRLVAVMNGDNSIRDYIAFPKNNSGRDVMIDSPSPIDNDQLDELNIKLK